MNNAKTDAIEVDDFFVFVVHFGGPVQELCAGRSKIRTGRRPTVVSTARRRRPGMKVLRFGEVLRDKPRTDYLSVDGDHAAVRLPGKDHLRNARHDRGINQSEKNGKHDGQSNSGPKFFNHIQLLLSLRETQYRENSVNQPDAGKRRD